MLCFPLLENAVPGVASQNSTIDEKMFLTRSLVEELHNPTILYARASHPPAAVYTIPLSWISFSIISVNLCEIVVMVVVRYGAAG